MAEFASNPKASFDYEILETIEAGLVLEGHEVKAIKTGKCSIKGSYVKIMNDRPVLIGATISPYQVANTAKEYDPQRDRQLLLSKRQIASLVGLANERGLTLVPLKIYEKKNRLKLLIGVAKGKKKYDKRESIKKREFERKEKQEF